jgi:hypothetical protein
MQVGRLNFENPNENEQKKATLQLPLTGRRKVAYLHILRIRFVLGESCTSQASLALSARLRAWSPYP